MSRPALKQEVPRDLSRAALADAIANLTAKRQARDEVQACLDALAKKRGDTWAEIEAAEAAITEAKACQREEVMASVMRGESFPTNRRLADAEQRLAMANEQRESLREAEEAFRTDLKDRDERIRWAEQDVTKCVRTVMWEAVPALTREIEPLRQRYRQLVESLSLITASFPGESPSADDPVRDLKRQADGFLRPILQNVHDLGKAGLPAEWAAARDRLHTDAYAPLPAIG